MKHLNASGQWASGNPRYYLRIKGQKAIPLPDLEPGSVEFLNAYHAAINGTLPRHKKAVSGTIRAGVEAYFASDVHAAKAKSTRALERRFGQEIADQYGDGTLHTLRAKHIRIALAKHEAHPANNRLRTWRALGKFWVDRGFIEADPARDVRPRQTPKSKGATPWTRQNFETFRAFWPIGTQERLAFEVMYQTCCAAVDLVKFGPANMVNGWTCYRRQKTGTEAVSPFAAPPAWFEASPHFLDALNAAPRHLTYLTTRGGASRSEKATSSWFSRACASAGLPGLSAHGIRKGRAAIFKENGAETEKRMAILGHETDAEARSYSQSADLMRVVAGAELPTTLIMLEKGAKNE